MLNVPAILEVTPATFAKPMVRVSEVTPEAFVANVKVQPTGTLISSPELLIVPTVNIVLAPLVACKLTDAVPLNTN